MRAEVGIEGLFRFEAAGQLIVVLCCHCEAKIDVKCQDPRNDPPLCIVATHSLSIPLHSRRTLPVIPPHCTVAVHSLYFLCVVRSSCSLPVNSSVLHSRHSLLYFLCTALLCTALLPDTCFSLHLLGLDRAESCGFEPS